MLQHIEIDQCQLSCHLTLCMLCSLSCFFVPSFFSKLTTFVFKKKSFNTISVNIDLARHSVGPDLGPNCLQMLSADDKSNH